MNFLLDEKVSVLNVAFESLTQDVQYLRRFIERQEKFDENVFETLKYRATIALDDQSCVKSFFFCPDDEDAKCLYLLNFLNGEHNNEPQASYRAMADEIGKFFDISFYRNSPKKQGENSVPWLTVAKEYPFGRWFGSYQNYNLENVEPSISYCEPVHLNGKFFGVIGIEINNLLLRTVIDDFGYGDAFTFLVSSTGDIVYHRDFQSGVKAQDFGKNSDLLSLSEFFSDEYVNSEKTYRYNYQGEKQRIILKSLKNGMVLALSVSEKQLFNLQDSMLLQMTMLFLLSLLVTFIIVNFLTTSIVKPIEVITEATAYIANGELKTKIPVKSKDELGTLASSILKIESELSEYIEHIRSLAYTDFMTACKNKSAYLKRLSVIENRIAENMADFVVYVFDVNGLKRINDTQGHEMGDELIKGAASALKTTFNEDDIFRTGGDEFVVIAEDDRANIEKNLQIFAQAVSDFNAENKFDFTLTVSSGYSIFEKGSDHDYKCVHERADKAMYDNKEAFYKTHEDLCRK